VFSIIVYCDLCPWSSVRERFRRGFTGHTRSKFRVQRFVGSNLTPPTCKLVPKKPTPWMQDGQCLLKNCFSIVCRCSGLTRSESATRAPTVPTRRGASPPRCQCLIKLLILVTYTPDIYSSAWAVLICRT